MGGIKDAMLFLHDRIETEVQDNLPDRLYEQMNFESNGTQLELWWYSYSETRPFVIVDVLQHAHATHVHCNGNSALFTGTHNLEAAGRYVAFLITEEE